MPDFGEKNFAPFLFAKLIFYILSASGSYLECKNFIFQQFDFEL